MTPGPTPVPPQVLLAMAEPIVHHRGADFRKAFVECEARLKEVYRTEHDVLMFAASGSGAMESAIVNLNAPGDRIVVHSAGNFGERWAKMGAAYGLDVAHLKEGGGGARGGAASALAAAPWREGWGPSPDPARLAEELEANPARAVYLTHSETSTRVVADVEAVAAGTNAQGATASG